MKFRLGENNKKPVKKVKHSDLKRYTEDSAYKSVCPVCKYGVLLIFRDKDFKLMALDRCTFCGQQIEYTDIKELRKMEGNE